MINRPLILACVLTLALLLGEACAGSPGGTRADSQVQAPSQISDFNVLYSENCAGCHGEEGRGGAAMGLANSVFLAIADDSVIRRTAAKGVAGTPMSAFAQTAGGMLTDHQIDVLVRGIRSWAKPEAVGGTPPAYTAQAPGDSLRGSDVYRTYCASCHGVDGRGGTKASSIVAGAYLALVSDQHLRTIVIAGRPELGAPDWRGDLPGQPMSEQEVSDVVAWLSSQRAQFPGQPYPRSADRAKGEPR